MGFFVLLILKSIYHQVKLLQVYGFSVNPFEGSCFLRNSCFYVAIAFYGKFQVLLLKMEVYQQSAASKFTCILNNKPISMWKIDELMDVAIKNYKYTFRRNDYAMVLFTHWVCEIIINSYVCCF